MQVIMLVGVNGAGKTTTIAKLSKQLIDADQSVAWVTADRFRAAASEQMAEWAKRLPVDLFEVEVKDPSAAVYKGMEYALSNEHDFFIIDTAGRQFNDQGLMAELQKTHRTIEKFGSLYPQHVWLVIEAGSGQNGVNQAKHFANVLPINGCIVTKLDGTAKGGMILSLLNEGDFPITYIGIGEQLNDLQTFELRSFVNSLLSA